MKGQVALPIKKLLRCSPGGPATGSTATTLADKSPTIGTTRATSSHHLLGGTPVTPAAASSLCANSPLEPEVGDRPGDDDLDLSPGLLQLSRMTDFLKPVLHPGASLAWCADAYTRKGPARWPCCCMFAWLASTIGFIVAGMVLKPMSIETDFSTFMKTDVNASTMRDAFLHALKETEDPQDGRRLNSAPQDIVRNYELVLAYELVGSPPKSGFRDEEVVMKVAEFEQRLKALPRWQLFCDLVGDEERSMCSNGISLASYAVPSTSYGEYDCEDDPDFVDEMGYTCANLVWYYCDSVADSFGYTMEGQESLVESCPRTCGTCTDKDGEVSRPHSLTLDGGGGDLLPFSAALHIIEEHDVRNLILNPADASDKFENIRHIRSLFRFTRRCCTTRDPPSMRSARLGEMGEEWLEFAREELLPVLQDASRGIKNGDWQLKVYFTGDQLVELEIMGSLFQDLYLAAGSMVFVIAYMLFHTRSILVSLVGFIVINLSIPTAYAIGAFATGTTSLSIASFLAVFLVVGLGSDVVFIYSDFWRDSAKHLMTLEDRLAWTALKGGKASLATTSITAVSFFANIASVLKPLREFGFFMGLCVVLVWVLLSGILVPLLVLTERYACSLDACRSWCWVLDWLFSRRARRHNKRTKPLGQMAAEVWFYVLRRWRLPCGGCAVVVVAACTIAAIPRLMVSTEVPQLFPEDHNQNRGKEVLDSFVDMAGVIGPIYSAKEQTLRVCSEHEFADFSNCFMHWCDLEVHQPAPPDGECQCFRNNTVSCARQDDGSAMITQHYVGLDSLTSSERAAIQSRISDLSGVGVDKFRIVRVEATGPIVQRDWETGAATLEPMVHVEVLALPVADAPPCGWQEVCYCGTQVCTLPSEFSSVPGLNLESGRRLSAATPGPADRSQGLQGGRAIVEEAGHGFLRDPGVARGLAASSSGSSVPQNQRAMVDVTFGIKVFLSSPLLGPVDLDQAWAFNEAHDMSNPWAQRSLYAFCTDVPDSLLVTMSRCWMEDFRTYAIEHYGKFPVFQAEFDSVAERFSYRALSDTSLAAKTLWMRDGFIKASYVSFWLDVDKRSADADFSLELKSRWDAHLDNYNEGASRTAKDAFHTSGLWVMAEAQKELVSGTLNTLVLAVSLAFVGMVGITFDWLLSFLVVCATCGIILCLMFHITVVMALPIGPIEVISLIVFIGYSVTYSLHVAHHYSGELPDVLPEGTTNLEIRFRRVKKALHAIGNAALGSAVTTSGCSVFLLCCMLTVFTRLGSVVLAVTMMSIAMALGPLPAVLLLVGPVKPGRCFPGIGRFIRSTHTCRRFKERQLARARQIHRERADRLAAEELTRAAGKPRVFDTPTTPTTYRGARSPTECPDLDMLHV
jgi:hypothetical protein